MGSMVFDRIPTLQVASPRSESWVLLFAVRKQPDESYCDLFRRIEATGNRIVRATPPKFSVQQQIDETSLFVAMKTLPPDDLHRQLVSQRGVSFMDAYLAFLRTYRDTANASAVESANAVFVARCHRCEEPGHLAKDCPFPKQSKQLVAKHRSSFGGGRGGGRGRGRGKGQHTTGEHLL